MSKTFKEQFVEALENGITHKAIYLAQFMKDEINEPYDYRSPLVWAKKYGNEKVIKALSDMRAVEVVDKEGMGKELLKILDAEDADKIDKKRAIELIKDGANIEKKDKFGNTALIKASSRRGCLDVVKTLISRGAKVDEKNNHDYTALIKASEYGLVEVVKALLDAGAKVDEKDNGGGTALIKASWYGNVEVVKALLDAGADVTIINNEGKTAIDYAGNDEIKKLLNDALRKQKEKQNEQTVKHRRESSLGE